MMNPKIKSELEHYIELLDYNKINISTAEDLDKSIKERGFFVSPLCQNAYNVQFSEDFLREYAPYFNDHAWKVICEYQKLSENFMRDFEDQVNWYKISVYQKLSEEFMEEFKDNLGAFEIFVNQDISFEFLREHFDVAKGFARDILGFNTKLSPEVKAKFRDMMDEYTEFKKTPIVDEEGFKRLISKGNNWYKTSQVYTSSAAFRDIDIAVTTSDPNILTEMIRREKNDYATRHAVSNRFCPPEILTEVIRRGLDDLVSKYAAMNPNCPPETLGEIIRRGRNDIVTWSAVANPNCPPEILASVLRKGRNSAISINAAVNPNCPPEILAEVLRRGYNDQVSRYAADNPSCPVEDKIKWMRDTGRITLEDPSKHVIDEVVNEEDKELDEFKKLISKTWYNNSKYASNLLPEEMVDYIMNNNNLFKYEEAKEIANSSKEWVLANVSLDNFNVLSDPNIKEELPPVILDVGTYDVIDGIHRIGSAKARQEKTIMAYIGKIE